MNQRGAKARAAKRFLPDASLIPRQAFMPGFGNICGTISPSLYTQPSCTQHKSFPAHGSEEEAELVELVELVVEVRVLALATAWVEELTVVTGRT